MDRPSRHALRHSFPLSGLVALVAIASSACGSEAPGPGQGSGGASASLGGSQGSGGASAGGSLASGGASAGGSLLGSGGSSIGGGASAGGSSGTGGSSAGGSSAGGGVTAGGSSAGGGVAAGGSDGAPSGGAVGAGGTGAGGAVSGNGGGGGTTCAVSPISPNASQQAKNVLCYLYDVYGTGVLSGQQETSWSNPGGDISFYVTNTGKSPAILGGDYLYPDGTTDRAKAYWQAGGLTMIRYHMGKPTLTDTYENSKATVNQAFITQVLTGGTPENQSFMSKLDYAAAELQKLEDANVAVLWAPFHEYQPNGWFWWSMGTPAQFKQLWQKMYDYFTATKGLTNLVWLAPSSGSPSGDWYPPKSSYDIAGPDTYDAGQPFASLYSQAKAIVGATVPIPLHETGKIPQPSQMFPTAAPWLLFSVWAGYESDTGQNSLQSIKDAYSSQYTITRDEVPNLK